MSIGEKDIEDTDILVNDNNIETEDYESDDAFPIQDMPDSHFTFSVSFSTTAHLGSMKLQGDQIGALQYETKEVTIEEFAHLTVNGFSFCPFVFKNNKRHSDCAIFSNMLAFDFDREHNIENIIEFLDTEFRLKTSFIYETASSTPEKPKHRLVICLEKPFTAENEKVRKKLYLYLAQKLGADTVCIDKARTFLPGRNLRIINNVVNRTTVDFIAWEAYIVPESSNRHSKANTRAFVEDKNDTWQRTIIENFEFAGMCKLSPVLLGFADGTVQLKYSALFALVTHMCFVMGGMQWMSNAMDKWDSLNPDNKYKYADRVMLKVIKKYNYAPADAKAIDPQLEGLQLYHLDKTTRRYYVLQKKN